jgi:hypothetical protein
MLDDVEAYGKGCKEMILVGIDEVAPLWLHPSVVGLEITVYSDTLRQHEEVLLWTLACVVNIVLRAVCLMLYPLSVLICTFSMT